MNTLKKMQNFVDWSKEIVKEKNNMYNDWKALSKKESAKVRILFRKEENFSRIWRYGIIGGVIITVLVIIKEILEKGHVNIGGIIVYAPIYILALIAVVYEAQCAQKRKNNLWVYREGTLWMIEKKYHIKYSIKTYFVITKNSEEISFDKNFVHGKIQEQDEVVLLRPIGSKEINLCLKEDFERYMKG